MESPKDAPSFSFALGGRDRHPFPVPLKTYDESLAVLRRSLDAAKIGDIDKADGLARLERFTCAVEQQYQPKADFDAVIANQEAISPSLNGRSVFDDRKKPSKQNRQLSFF